MRSRKIWTVLLLLYVGFVFHNSMTPAVDSSAQSLSVLEAVQTVLDTVGLDHVGITEHIIRKMAHFGEYTVLGMLLMQCLGQYRLMTVSRWQLHALFGFLIPFVDETIQLFTEGRSGQISDVWLDCSGVMFGTVVCLAVCLWRRRPKRKSRKKHRDGQSV